MSLTTTTVTENGTLSTKGRFYVRPRNRPEGEGAARYPEGNPRSNTTLHQYVAILTVGRDADWYQWACNNYTYGQLLHEQS